MNSDNNKQIECTWLTTSFRCSIRNLNKAQWKRMKRLGGKNPYAPLWGGGDKKIERKKNTKFYPPRSLGVMVSLSRPLSVLTSLSLKISHSTPAHNKHTSFSRTKIGINIIMIIFTKWKICFWGLEFHSNRTKN